MINIRSKALDKAEIAWFGSICNGDDQYLSRHDDAYKSNWLNTSKIVRTADMYGFRMYCALSIR